MMSDLEMLLLRLWREALDDETVSLEDNFFELGGQSISAMQIISRLEVAQGLSLPIRLIFDHPTIPSLAIALEELKVEREIR